MVDVSKMKKRKATGESRRPGKSFAPEDMIGYVEGPKGRSETGVLSFEAIEHITDKAALLRLEGDNKIWVPKSQIVDADENSIEVTTWWAGENDVTLE